MVVCGFVWQADLGEYESQVCSKLPAVIRQAPLLRTTTRPQSPGLSLTTGAILPLDRGRSGRPPL